MNSELRPNQVKIIQDYIQERIADNQRRSESAPELVRPMFETSICELKNVHAAIEHACKLNELQPIVDAGLISQELAHSAANATEAV